MLQAFLTQHTRLFDKLSAVWSNHRVCFAEKWWNMSKSSQRAIRVNASPDLQLARRVGNEITLQSAADKNALDTQRALHSIITRFARYLQRSPLQVEVLFALEVAEDRFEKRAGRDNPSYTIKAPPVAKQNQSAVLGSIYGAFKQMFPAPAVQIPLPPFESIPRRVKHKAIQGQLDVAAAFAARTLAPIALEAAGAPNRAERLRNSRSSPQSERMFDLIDAEEQAIRAALQDARTQEEYDLLETVLKCVSGASACVGVAQTYKYTRDRKYAPFTATPLTKFGDYFVQCVVNASHLNAEATWRETANFVQNVL